jgi:hypothetical protein
MATGAAGFAAYQAAKLAPQGAPPRRHWPDCILRPGHSGDCDDGY